MRTGTNGGEASTPTHTLASAAAYPDSPYPPPRDPRLPPKPRHRERADFGPLVTHNSATAASNRPPSLARNGSFR